MIELKRNLFYFIFFFSFVRVSLRFTRNRIECINMIKNFHSWSSTDFFSIFLQQIEFLAEQTDSHINLVCFAIRLAPKRRKGKDKMFQFNIVGSIITIHVFRFCEIYHKNTHFNNHMQSVVCIHYATSPYSWHKKKRCGKRQKGDFLWLHMVFESLKTWSTDYGLSNNFIDNTRTHCK